jgi:hypothetical protein
MTSAPLNDTVLIAVAQLVDDAQTGRRDPSHYDLGAVINRAGLSAADPQTQGLQVGKAKRVRAVLNWALDNDPEAGGRFVYSFIGTIRGHGGFRVGSQNFVGQDVIDTAISAFASEGYVLTSDGELRPVVLDNLSGPDYTEALIAYIRRAKRGVADAALLVGTGKDLLEAVCEHIMQQRLGIVPSSNFPTLLGQLYIELGLATPQNHPVSGEPTSRRMERAMYELACSINALRNKEGTGHGRPWLSSVSDAEARMAIESMGIIAERLFAAHSARRR